MKTNLKAAIEKAVQEKPLLRLVEKAQIVTTMPAPSNDDLRLDQYRRQKEMLQEALKNAAVAPTEEMLAKQHQPVRYTADDREKIARQAAQQENGGSIFSAGYSRFHFV